MNAILGRSDMLVTDCQGKSQFRCELEFAGEEPVCFSPRLSIGDRCSLAHNRTRTQVLLNDVVSMLFSVVAIAFQDCAWVAVKIGTPDWDLVIQFTRHSPVSGFCCWPVRQVPKPSVEVR